MKNLTIIIALLVTVAASAKIKPNEQAEWNKYMAYCNRMVPDTIEQTGKATFVAQVIIQKDITLGNGKVLKAGTCDYIWKTPSDAQWFAYDIPDYKIGSIKTVRGRSYYYEPKEACIVRKQIVLIKQRRPTEADFRQNWLTHVIPGN